MYLPQAKNPKWLHHAWTVTSSFIQFINNSVSFIQSYTQHKFYLLIHYFGETFHNVLFSGGLLTAKPSFPSLCEIKIIKTYFD